MQIQWNQSAFVEAGHIWESALIVGLPAHGTISMRHYFEQPDHVQSLVMCRKCVELVDRIEDLSSRTE